MKKLLLTSSLLLSFCFLHASPHSFNLNAQQPARVAAPAQAAENTSRLAGLRAPVRILRDERGIPHIEASNETDLYFAQGYATASDRLWQMDLLRRTARGELSEIFGRPVLEEDKRRRILGFGALSESLVARASAQTRATLEAYARGVNAYIESRDGSKEKMLPVEFQLLGYKPRPWLPADSLVLAKLFAETLSTTWQTDLSRAMLADLPPARRAQLLPDTSPLDVIVVGSDEPKPQKKSPKSLSPVRRKVAAKVRAQSFTSLDEREGVELLEEVARVTALSRSSLERVGLFMEDRAVSNNWVASGARTASGKPLLANDPHLPASAPSIWHMAHLRAPGLHVAGVTAPGAPGVIIGHNEQIVWGMTNLGPDVQDLYLEKFSADKKNFYETPTGLREAEVRREEIKVRKGLTDASTETVTLDVTVTRHGPIILEREGKRYALRWTALDPKTNEFDAFYSINRARNWNEFRAALANYTGPTQNFVYADTLGHIGYYGAGLIPVRQSGDGSVPYDGATDEGEWKSFIPFPELPHSYDPPSGLIVTANSRVVGRSYPYHLTHEWAEPYRSRRIYDLLSKKGKLTEEDFRAVQGDTYSIGGSIFAREAAKLLRATTTTDEKFRASLALLENWDGHVNADSQAAPLVAEMRTAFRRRILTAALGAERARSFRWPGSDLFFNRIVSEHPAEWLPKEFKDYGELVRACVEDAQASLSKRTGANETPWTWGRYAPARFQHPLAIVPFIGQQFAIEPVPVNGSGFSAGATVNVGTSVSMRLIANLSDWDKTRQGIALGLSGDPASPHWTDQLNDWRAAAPRVFPFSSKATVAAARETLVLAPK